MKTAAIVLAAGKSERMGKNKLLIKLCGKRLIDHILDALEASKVDETIIVLGYKPGEIIEALMSRLNRMKVVINERYEEGMTSSFKTGLKQVEHVDAALLVLGDQLILDPKLINAMIEQMERSGALIVSPIYKGKKGHPLLFSKRLFNEILRLRRGEVIRDVVHKHCDSLLTIEAARWTVMDIDTAKDLADVVRLL